MASAISFEMDSEEEWVLARQGFKLLINNKGKEAENLFLKYPESLVMFSGYSFVVFMDALMSFEEDKLTKAITTLREVERRCNNRDWFKFVKTKMFGTADEEPSLIESLETQIILADSQVCLAILVFLQQDISGYLKAGWVLRRAWKVYQKTYIDILNLYNSHIGPLNLPDPTLITSSSENIVNNEKEILLSNNDETVEIKLPNGKTGDNYLNKKTIIRLMNAVTFGYGLFQLGVSLLPTTLLRLTSFLGLSGNRMHGLACLMYSRLGVDMRAPLATLSLLWYHCIVRPFYAFDGINIGAGVHIADQLIKETTEEYADSALFLFFKGRLCRLNSNIPEALKSFQSSVNNATQREIKLISLHEVGWCYLIKLDFKNAELNFSHLSSWSRWSKPFYSYITCICKGSLGELYQFEEFEDYIINIRSSSKTNQLDEFLNKRVSCFPTNNDDFKNTFHKYWRYFVYEMLYLWNALASCTKEDILKIVDDCSVTSSQEPMKGISNLLRGACYVILGDTDEAKLNFQVCIESRTIISPKKHQKDDHVLAFAQYELGAILLTTPETKDEGKRLLQETILIKDYDFEERLSVRISTMLRHSSE